MAPQKMATSADESDTLVQAVANRFQHHLHISRSVFNRFKSVSETGCFSSLLAHSVPSEQQKDAPQHTAGSSKGYVNKQ